MRKEKLKIGFLSEFSPYDRKASSGTNYKMAEQLQDIGDIKWIPISKTRKSLIVEKFIRGISKILGKEFDIYSTSWGSRNGYEPINPVKFDDIDVVAAFFCSPLLANLRIDKPIVYFTDATYPSMIDYYWHDRWKMHNKQGTELERLAMENASAIIVSSKWCADSTKNDLNIPSEKVHIVEFGANIDDKDISAGYRKEKQIDYKIEILFLGVDWERKGGDIAVEAVRWLNENGIPANLNIVGIRNLSPEISQLPFVTNIGFLNKNIREDYELLCKTIAKCHLELLPTKAEASAIAFAEAAAYGLPVFTHDTGGIGNYIINGVNGFRLPLGSTGRDFGLKIKEVLDSNQLPSLSNAARKLYESTLNWNVWGAKVEKILRSLINF